MSDGHAYDEQGLPWLEAVDDEDGPRPISAGKMLAWVMLVLVAAGLIAGGFFLLGRKDPVMSGAPELIRAPQGPYKVRPVDPGGLDIAGESGTAFATSAGEDTDAALDPSKMSSEDVTPGAPPPETVPAAPKRPPPAEVKSPVQDSGAAAPAAAGPTIQLGAYASRIKAETAWSMLSGRFPAVADLSKQVVPYNGGFRLRAGAASPAQAKAACVAVTAGGENCFVVR